MKKNIIIAVLSLVIICGAIIIVTSRISNTAQEIVSNAIMANTMVQSFEADLTTTIEQNDTSKGAITSTVSKSQLIYFNVPRKYKLESSIVIKSSNDIEEHSVDFLRYFKTEYTENLEEVIYDFNFQENRWDIRRYPVNMQISFNIDRENTVKEDIEFYLRSADNFEKSGQEKIKEYNTIKLTGKITGTQIVETIKRFVTLDNEIIDRASNEIDSIDVVFWVDKKSYHVVKYIVDLAEIYNLLYEKIFSQAREENPEVVDVTIEKYMYETVIFNFNQATEFEIPQEALEAQQQSAMPPEN